MKKVDDFVKSVRELKKQCPATIIFLPPLNRGLPSGSWNLMDLLETIAMNLEGKKPLCRKGVHLVKIKARAYLSVNSFSKSTRNCSGC